MRHNYISEVWCKFSIIRRTDRPDQTQINIQLGWAEGTNPNFGMKNNAILVASLWLLGGGFFLLAEH